MSLEMDQFHEVYFAESFELLDAMEAALLRLTPGDADVETVNTIFRVAHSIKGGAGMFGFNEIGSFTHTLETLLDELRSCRMQVTGPICDGLLHSVDVIRGMLTAQQKLQPLDLTVSQALQEQFRQIVSAAAGEDEPLAPVAVIVKPAPVPTGIAVWRIRFTALPGLLPRGIDPVRMFEDLAGLGELTVTADLSQVPALEAITPAECRIRWELLLTSPMPRASIELIFDWAEGDCELTMERVDAPAAAVVIAPAQAAQVAGQRAALVAEPAAPLAPTVPAPAESVARIQPVTAPAAAPTTAPEAPPPVPAVRAVAARPAPAAATVEVNSIRVAIEKIDELLNVVGEVVITQSMLGQLAKDFEGVNADRLRSGLAQLEANVRELQESVMRVRMLPVGSVF